MELAFLNSKNNTLHTVPVLHDPGHVACAGLVAQDNAGPEPVPRGVRLPGLVPAKNLINKINK